MIWLIRNMIHYLGNLHFITAGVYPCTKTNVVYDYKKYLGPDWEPKFTGTGLQVANHTSWFDIIALMNLDLPSFVAKSEIAKGPIIA